MPIGIGRYAEVAAAAIRINARYNAVVTVFKAGIDGIDVIDRSQRAIEQVSALLGAEIAGVRAASSATMRNVLVNGSSRLVVMVTLSLRARVSAASSIWFRFLEFSA